MTTTRLRLDLAYDGTDFSGWACQPGLRTVQAELERALSRALRLAPVGVTCAGRTDAGVHARGQVVHADVPGPVDPLRLRARLNRALPDDVVVGAVAVAPEGFDARFSAVWRRYVYRVCDQPERLDPLQRRQVLCWRRPVNAPGMDDAARGLVGEHDFASYCRTREGATTVRTILTLGVQRTASGLIETTVVADAFCHSMVRALVGALLAVGDGRLAGDEPTRILAARRRDPRVQVVAGRGLTLDEVGYPADDALAARATEARARREPVP